MGMTIDVAKVNLRAIQVYYNDDMQDSYVGFDKEDNESVEVAIETMHKYQMMQADYEARLKADMVAMLTEIQLEIEELNMHGFIQLQSFRQKTGRYRQGFERAQYLSTKVIHQKINALKGE